METLVAVQEYVTEVAAWQRSLDRTDARFAEWLGVEKSDWSRYQRAAETRRYPGAMFHARVMAKATKPWSSAIEEAWQRYLAAQQRDMTARVLAAEVVA